MLQILSPQLSTRVPAISCSVTCLLVCANILLTQRPHTIQYSHMLDCNLISAVMTGWHRSKEAETARRGHRLGYMGHLGNIAASIADFPSAEVTPTSLTDEVH